MNVFKRLISMFFLALLTSAAHAAGPQPSVGTLIKKISVVTDATLPSPARYGIAQLETALRAKGLNISEYQSADADFVIVAGTSTAKGPAATALHDLKTTVPAGPEALAISTRATYQGKPAVILAGSDATGLMYASLDVADRVSWSTAANPFQFVRETAESPYLKDRGVVMFTMNRAYFESHLHDEQYWIHFFDTLAKDRFNHMVLVFGYEDGGYMAPLYPYFYDVPGFPDVKVVGLTPEQQAQNLKSFKTMIRIATERGITIKPGIWDHIYRAGIQAGGIPGASNGNQPAPGLVWGLNADNLIPYTVAALKKFYETFPEFTETQFRMHEESGLKVAEIEKFWHEVFAFYRTAKPDITLELRVKNLPKSVIKDAQAQGLKIQLDTKIWMEQMGLPYHSTHINRDDQNNARQSYADLLEYPQTYHMNWTLWNGGTTRILQWSDPEYARRLVQIARLYDGQALTVTEMEATKMLGAPHDAKPYNFLNDKYRYTDYEFERYWAFYRVFGRLSYNPETPADTWDHEYVARFGVAAGPHVEKAIELASTVLPRVVAASVPYSQFPTTTGWPEMMHLGGLSRYAQQQAGSDIQQFMNVRDEATSILQSTDTPMRRPEETSHWFSQTSDAILAEVAAAERALGSTPASNEFKSTITDVKMLAAMARYHASRLLGAVNYNLYRQAGDLAAFDQAVVNEGKAVQAWHDLVNAAGDFYVDNMWFGATGRNYPHHWKDEMKLLDNEYAQLRVERQAVTARPDAKSARIPNRPESPQWPVVTFSQTSALPVTGENFLVQVEVTAFGGVKSVRLRYRHLNQKEEYQTADMILDAKSGLYGANIPGGFIDPHWDLMYFVEVIDNNGNGRMYPDLERETPYVVVGVKR